MKIDQNPFSIYDFLGYLIPGLFFIYASIFVFNFDFQKNNIAINFDMKIDQYFIITILAYVIGHILSFISSITIESFAIWTLGYPSRYLLAIPFPVTFTDFLVRRILRTKKLLGKSADAFSISLIKNEIPKFLNTNYKVSKKDSPLDKDGNDFFNIIYHYALENSTTHVTKMQNYVALYGFTRTLCLSVIFIIWLIIIRGFGGVFSVNVSIALIVLTSIAGLLYIDFNKFYRKFSLEAFMAFLSIKNKA